MDFRYARILLSAFAGSMIAAGGSIAAHAQYSTPAATEAANAAVQSAIQNARDQLFYNRNRNNARPLGFAADPTAYDSFDALSYGERDPKSPFYTKAIPAPVSNPVQTSIWGTGSGAFERRDQTFQGVDVGTRSSTATGIVGVDFLKTGLSSPTDAFLIGFLAGDTASRSTQTGFTSRTQSPSIGAYAAYIAGDFSTDVAFTTNFNRTATPQFVGGDFVTNQTSYSFAHNVNYRITAANGWWVEPTAGYSYTYGAFSDADRLRGNSDTESWRVQGGARFGTDFMWNAVRVEPSFYAGVYDDVSIRPIVLFGPPNEEGKVLGKASAKLNFVYSQNFSIYIQGEVHGRTSNVGEIGTVGLRYTF